MSNAAGWRAYAEVSDFGRNIDLHIGREYGRDVQFVSACNSTGLTVSTDRLDAGVLPPAGLRLDRFVAEEVYKALDRVFGHANQDGAVEVLQAVLAKEQARVDKVLESR